MGTLIRGGRVITAIDDFHADVYVDDDGRIAAIGRGLEKRGAKDDLLDAGDLYLIPGGIDPHVHMELPFMGTVSRDDFESGTAAAAHGGTTTIIDFAIQSKGQSLLDTIAQWHEKARKAVGDYSFHCAVTDYNDKTGDEIARVVAQGVTSFKCFLAYKGALEVTDDQLYQILVKTKEAGAFVNLHCENADVIDYLIKKFVAEGKAAPKYHALAHPAEIEGQGTERAIRLAAMVGQQIYIVHMTCRSSLAASRAAQYRGEPVFSETCTQYLVLDDSCYEQPNFRGAAYVMSPPIRKKEDQEALWESLRTGFTQVVGTDHCPFDLKGQKEMGKESFAKIPNGAAGVEERLDILHEYGVRGGRISLNQWVAVTSTNAARIFGLYPRKGAIAIGADADLVLYDPNGERTIGARNHHSRCDTNIFEGFKVHGRAVTTLVRGRPVVKDGKFVGERGYGRFLRREPNSSRF